jgi:ATP-dependent Clp protease protease subunit
MAHPVVVREQTDKGYEQFDVYSRLFEDRIIYLDTDFNDHMSSLICTQLMVLANQSEKEITLYINSPGGVVTSGLAIYDTMQMIPNVIKTVAVGNACSMGSFILSAGTKGHRYVSPSSRVMIHRISGGAHGSMPDMEITLEEARRINDYLHERMAVHCGKTVKQMKEHMDRDKWFDAKGAVKFGIVDHILEPKNKTAWK